MPPGQREAFIVRIAEPFSDVAVDQLLVEIRLGEAASDGVVALETSERTRNAVKLSRTAVMAVILGAVVAAIVEMARHWY